MQQLVQLSICRIPKLMVESSRYCRLDNNSVAGFRLFEFITRNLPRTRVDNSIYVHVFCSNSVLGVKTEHQIRPPIHIMPRQQLQQRQSLIAFLPPPIAIILTVTLVILLLTTILLPDQKQGMTSRQG
jgi:hypothetical protein